MQNQFRKCCFASIFIYSNYFQQIKTLYLHKILPSSDPFNFPFYQTPPFKTISQAVELLESIDALDHTEDKLLTPLGNLLSLLPVEVSVGKMLIYGSILNYTEEICLLAGIISVQVYINIYNIIYSLLILIKKQEMVQIYIIKEYLMIIQEIHLHFTIYSINGLKPRKKEKIVIIGVKDII